MVVSSQQYARCNCCWVAHLFGLMWLLLWQSALELPPLLSVWMSSTCYKLDSDLLNYLFNRANKNIFLSNHIFSLPWHFGLCLTSSEDQKKKLLIVLLVLGTVSNSCASKRSYVYDAQFLPSDASQSAVWVLLWECCLSVCLSLCLQCWRIVITYIEIVGK